MESAIIMTVEAVLVIAVATFFTSGDNDGIGLGVGAVGGGPRTREQKNYLVLLSCFSDFAVLYGQREKFFYPFFPEFNFLYF